jgi:purine-nucleoside phosphorylase
MQGRFHPYEGYATAICTLPMRVFKLIGVETLVLTAAAGGVNETYNVGDIMIIKDHIALPIWSLNHPLVGENDERFGPRFPPTNRLYKKSLREIFKQTGAELNVELKEGIYISYGGPSYETVSEIRAFRMMGADAVGMSTAHEAIVAGHCGMNVFALALITNKAVHEYDSEVQANHEEVVFVANQKAKTIEDLVINFVGKI